MTTTTNAPIYFAYFMGYICTANADGSIPINARMVCKVEDTTMPYFRQLLEQANAAAKAENME